MKCLRSNKLAPLTGEMFDGVSLTPLEFILEGEPKAVAILDGGETDLVGELTAGPNKGATIRLGETFRCGESSLSTFF